MAASLWWDEPEDPNKSDSQNKNEELLVFGYACKLFRDDKKARAIENGKMLIPWMGDERLMIDRYDGRGHLYDLALHDADSVEDKNPVLTEEEAAIEKACDEERYLELHHDIREAQLYEEEEWKRYYLSLQEGYQAVGFSYDQQSGNFDSQQQGITEAAKEEEEKPFIVPVELHVPPDVVIPTCAKQNARIEKTASFISQHGIQMEIMLKTKQAGNTQFDFLHFDNELNPYYKHVVSMIKSGKYKPQEEEDDSDDHSQGYLHPSLSSTASLLPPIPPPALKPIELPKVSIHDTPYGALIKSIRMNTETSRLLAASQAAARSPLQEPETQATVGYSNNPPPPGTEPVTLPTVSSLIGPIFVEQLYHQPPPPGTEENSAPSPKVEKKRRKRSSSSDSSSSSPSSSSSYSSSSSSRSTQSSGPERKRPRGRKHVAEPIVEGPSPVVLPPPEALSIIDRMALYVAKNGVEFEMVVMSRKDPRFQFLNEDHDHYHYYKTQKEKYLQELGKTGLEMEGDVQDDKLGNNSQRSVSFSIKSRPKEQESGQPSGKARLFEYDSSEGEDKQDGETHIEVTSGAATPVVKTQADEESQKEIEEKLKDKLASAVKERISQNHREKQLQMERKRKAAAFLTLIKSSQTTEPPLPPQDLSSLYVAEERSPGPLVFEYDNQSRPQLVMKKEHSSKSSKEKKKRRRSPTPPSAYSLDKRSPSRPTPPAWPNRPAPWAGVRDRATPWQRWPRERAVPGRRSRSRSPHKKEEKKKKHKRSKSKSPSRREKNKEKSRHTQEKSKSKSKDREKKKKEKSRHKSRDRDTRQAQGKQSRRTIVVDNEVDSDYEKLDKSPPYQMFSEQKAAMRNGSTSLGLELGSVPVPGGASSHYSLVEGVPRHSKSFTHSEITDDLQVPSSRHSSRCNSPVTHASSVSRGSTPSRSSTDTTSTDLMAKVRAMLKKSRELILKEEGHMMDDT